MNLQLVKRIEEMALCKGCSPGQLALAWLLTRGEDIVPIFGTKKRIYLKENLEALDIRMTEEDLRLIEEVMPPEAATGARYPESVMKLINR